MSSVAPELETGEQLRVALYAPNPWRRRVLSKVLADLGHLVVGAEDVADVVLADGDDPSAAQRPAVVLGAKDGCAPGLLPANAGPGQIDAALRAVAAGLIVRSAGATDSGFDRFHERDAHELLTPRELEVIADIM